MHTKPPDISINLTINTRATTDEKTVYKTQQCISERRRRIKDRSRPLHYGGQERWRTARPIHGSAKDGIFSKTSKLLQTCLHGSGVNPKYSGQGNICSGDGFRWDNQGVMQSLEWLDRTLIRLSAGGQALGSEVPVNSRLWYVKPEPPFCASWPKSAGCRWVSNMQRPRVFTGTSSLG